MEALKLKVEVKTAFDLNFFMFFILQIGYGKEIHQHFVKFLSWVSVSLIFRDKERLFTLCMNNTYFNNNLDKNVNLVQSWSVQH